MSAVRLVVRAGAAVVAAIGLALLTSISAQASTNTPGIGWLNPDGTLNTQFSAVGMPNDTVIAIARQADGKMVLGGTFTAYGTTPVPKLVRLNTDGSIDTSFVTHLGTGVPSTSPNAYQVQAIAIDSLGRILVGGNFTTFNGAAVHYLVRLNTDGTRDTSFDAVLGTGPNSDIQAIAVDSQNRIALGGNFTALGSNAVSYVGRLTSSGAPDTSFNASISGGTSGTVVALSIDSQDRIVAGGVFSNSGDWSTSLPGIVRYGATGSIDTAFMTNVGAGATTVNALATDSLGHIIVGGQFTTFDTTTVGNFVRLNSDGTVDSAFMAQAGAGFTSPIWAVAADSQNRVIIAGGWSASVLSRFHADGSIDSGFASNVGVGFGGGYIATIGLTSCDQLVVGGSFTTFSGTAMSPATVTTYCPANSGPSGQQSDPALASTGANSTALLAATCLLAGVGFGCVLLGRRQRSI